MGNVESLAQGDSNNNNFISSSSVTLKASLGEGSIGGVFRAELTTANGIQTVAVRKLRQINYKQIDINYLCGIRHKNVIAYIGLVADAKPPMIVMELGTNGSLYDYLRKHKSNRLQPSQVCSWMSQIAGSIKFIHSLRDIEAEVKSPNFIIFAGSILKLGDFHPPSNQALTSNPSLDKIRWLAPEVYREKTRNPKSDVFSCGIVFWEVLTGEVPYEGLSRGDIQYKVSGTQQLRPMIPPECAGSIRGLLEDCWRSAPAGRPDAASVKSRVKDIIAKGCKLSNKLEKDHDVRTNPYPTAICCYAPNKRPNLLAVSTRGGKKKSSAIEVYDVTQTNMSPVYTLESPDWGMPPIDVAATKGMILVICYRGRYIYQFQKYKSATKENQKFEIAETMNFRYPRCIAVNQRCAVVGIEEKNKSAPGTLVVFSVPSLQRVRQIELHFIPYGLDLNDVASNFLLIMGSNQISVRNIADDITKEIGKINTPNEVELFGSVFEMGSASLMERVGASQSTTDPPSVFTVSSSAESTDSDKIQKLQNVRLSGGKTDHRSSDVRRYGWDIGKSNYGDSGVVINGAGVAGRSGLRITRDGACAISDPNANKLVIFK